MKIEVGGSDCWCKFPDKLEPEDARMASMQFANRRCHKAVTVKSALIGGIRFITSIGEVPGMAVGYLVGSGLGAMAWGCKAVVRGCKKLLSRTIQPLPSLQNAVNFGNKLGAKIGQMVGGAVFAPVAIATLPIFGTEAYILEHFKRKKIENNLYYYFTNHSEGRGKLYINELERVSEFDMPLYECLGLSINKIPSLFDRGAKTIGSVTKRIYVDLNTVCKSLLQRVSHAV